MILCGIEPVIVFGKEQPYVVELPENSGIEGIQEMLMIKVWKMTGENAEVPREEEQCSAINHRSVFLSLQEGYLFLLSEWHLSDEGSLIRSSFFLSLFGR